MRSEIRRANAEESLRVAVVCGAWHVRALRLFGARGQASKDTAALQGLPKVKTAAAWVPWSYERLAYASGYGAGLHKHSNKSATMRTPPPYASVSTMILASASLTDSTTTFEPSRPCSVPSSMRHSQRCPSAR